MMKYNKKLIIISISTISILLVLYLGIGYVIASQAIAAKPGCGLWSGNTPSNWSPNDDWSSFEPWPSAQERIRIRRDFDVTPYQIPEYEEVSFHPRNEPNITLKGWYIEVDPLAPVVIQTHGMPTNGKCKPEMLLMQGYLTEGGINSLSFDLRNYGESDVVGDYFAVGQIEYNDLLGAYDWLVSDKSYRSGQIGMSAFSAGGGAAIAFAEEPGITALWLDSAVLDFPLVVRNELKRLGYPSIFSQAAITVGGWLVGVKLDERSPMEAADSANDRPVFLTHGKKDPRVSIVHSQRFEQRIINNKGNVTAWYVDNRAHVDAIWGESIAYKKKLIDFFSHSLSFK
ncbi:MAG TPA: hypothetical protein DCL76_05435 [Chloroflexi bacterium]|nr:hypothetical protein [Chloroflexota bacterium]HCU99050.1 hypothetical protein [Chloroflexota bacterium]